MTVIVIGTQQQERLVMKLDEALRLTSKQPRSLPDAAPTPPPNADRRSLMIM
jgi:hypothetical protein